MPAHKSTAAQTNKWRAVGQLRIVRSAFPGGRPPGTPIQGRTPWNPPGHCWAAFGGASSWQVPSPARGCLAIGTDEGERPRHRDNISKHPNTLRFRHSSLLPRVRRHLRTRRESCLCGVLRPAGGWLRAALADAGRHRGRARRASGVTRACCPCPPTSPPRVAPIRAGPGLPAPTCSRRSLA